MDDKYKNCTDEELRAEFEVLRSKIIKKCNGCVKSYVNKDDDDHCNGWTKTKCMWECDEDAKDLVKEANQIADHFALTEEEIDKISHTLESNRSDNSKLMKNILETHPDQEENGLVKEVMEVSFNPYTGKVDNAKPYEKNEDVYSMDELIFGDIRPSYTEETVNQIADMYSIKKDDAYKVLKLIRSKDTEDLYSKLPLAMRNVVNGMVEDDMKSSYDEAAKNLLLQFQSDIEINEKMVDLDKSIKESYSEAASEICGLEYTDVRDVFENKMKQSIEKINQELNDVDMIDDDRFAKMSQIEKIASVSKSYTESYHCTQQIRYLSLISQKNKRKINDISKYNSIVNAFNERYRYNTRNIKDIRMILPILYRKLHPTFTWVTEDLIKKFIMLTCLACDKMQPENIAEHVYMFYTVQNITMLDLVDCKNKDQWGFAKEIMNNCLYVLYILKDISRNNKSIKIDPNTLLPIIPDMLNNQIN